MAKKDNLKELEHTKEWCLAILNFLIEKGGKSPVFDEFVNAVITSYNNGNLKGLKHLVKDLNEWARSLALGDLVELNAILLNRFDENLDKSKKTDLEIINKIISFGKIKNEEEYGLLLNRVEEIYNDNSKIPEVQILNNLLAGFHK